VRTIGQAAHSAYPHLGQSATRDLVHLLANWTRSICRRTSSSARRRSTSDVERRRGGQRRRSLGRSPLDDPARHPRRRRDVAYRGVGERTRVPRVGPMVPPMKLGVVGRIPNVGRGVRDRHSRAHQLGNALPLWARLNPRRAPRRRMRPHRRAAPRRRCLRAHRSPGPYAAPRSPDLSGTMRSNFRAMIAFVGQ
jgi:hypothetical protein